MAEQSIKPRDDKTTLIVVCIVAIVVILGLYWRVQSYEFCWDDGLYVKNNEHVRSGVSWENARWAFSTGCASHWHPLTWLSHMLVCEFFGLDAGWHHLTNVLLHCVNTILLFLVFQKITGRLWESAFVAALFALHPLRVESVAWVTERKDLLSTFFWLLTMWSYVLYAERGGFLRYLVVAVLLGLGLMSKPMLVTLPFVLLLLDYWPLGRVRAAKLVESGLAEGANGRMRKRTPTGLILEKIPLFVLTAVSCAITYLVGQTGGAVKDIPFSIRLSNAVVSYGRYISKAVWPSGLAVFYPYPARVETVPLILSAILVILVTAIAVFWRQRRPWLLVGWLWYLGTLVPVIGLVQVGGQAMADRYTYIPLMGIFVVLAWMGSELSKKLHINRGVCGVIAGTILGILALCTWFQIRYWRNNVTLYERALSVGPGNALLHNNLAVEYAALGQTEKAVRQYEEALRMNPQHYKSRYNLGTLLLEQGKVEEAVSYLEEAVRLKPDGPDIRNILAAAYFQQGKYDQAEEQWFEALRLKPNWAEVHNNLAAAFLEQGNIEKAIEHCSEALRLRPDWTEVRNTLRKLEEMRK